MNEFFFAESSAWLTQVGLAGTPEPEIVFGFCERCVLLGDLPALTKSETFYQRLLVGDTDDLQEQAEESLKESTLSSYYDKVAMPGLEMAARDLARGVLTDAQLQRIQDTMAALVAEIGSQPDKEPEPGVADDVAHSEMIRCVAGRTELDFAVATILVQLLTRKGCRAEVIANPAVSREYIGSFSQEDVSLVGLFTSTSAERLP